MVVQDPKCNNASDRHAPLLAIGILPSFEKGSKSPSPHEAITAAIASIFSKVAYLFQSHSGWPLDRSHLRVFVDAMLPMPHDDSFWPLYMPACRLFEACTSLVTPPSWCVMSSCQRRRFSSPRGAPVSCGV